MSEFSTYYTTEKVRTYDADEVDALMVEVGDIIVDVKDVFREAQKGSDDFRVGKPEEPDEKSSGKMPFF